MSLTSIPQMSWFIIIFPIHIAILEGAWPVFRRTHLPIRLVTYPSMDDFPSCHLWYSNDLPSIPLISILHYIHMIFHWWFLSYPLAIKYPEDIPLDPNMISLLDDQFPTLENTKKNDNLSHLILLIDWVRWFPRHCWLRPLYCIHIKDPQYIPTCNMLSDMIFIYSPSWSIPIISLIFHNCWLYIYMHICPQNIPWHIPIISPLCFEQKIPSSLYNYPHIPMQIVASSYPPVI